MDRQNEPPPAGFCVTPQSELSTVALEALNQIYERLGASVQQDELKCVIMLMRPADDDQIISGSAFGGFSSPEEMIVDAAAELTHMASYTQVRLSLKAGVADDDDTRT